MIFRVRQTCSVGQRELLLSPLVREQAVCTPLVMALLELLCSLSLEEG